MKSAPALALLVLSCALAACGAEPPPVAKPAPPPARPRDRLSYAELKSDQMTPLSKYPIKTCVITGKDLATLGHRPYAISYKGYEMQFCSEDCVDTFASDPEGYVRKMNPKAMFDNGVK